MVSGNDEKERGFTGEHIVLTSHLEQMKTSPTPINWGEKDALERGPILGTNQSGGQNFKK